MIPEIDLNSYSKQLKKGLNKLNSYHSWMRKFSILLFLTSIGGLVYLYETLGKTIIAQGNGVEKTFHNLMVALNQPENFNIACACLGALVCALLFNLIHKKRLDSQIKTYVQEIHPHIISKHKTIFKSHTKEAIDSFREERNKKRLIMILSEYHSKVEFILNNYDDLSGEN